MHPEKNIDQRQQGEKKPSKSETLSQHNEKKPLKEKLKCEVSI